ncbi:MAG: aldo/keto reductase [Planctomycetota bacterium]|jgi:aryl-alcohol dehydrogenase-like predicted oxidoreductase
MEMKRREFLARSIAGMGGALLGSCTLDASRQKTTKHDPYKLVTLGKTKIKVPRVGLGTGMRGGNRQSTHSRMGTEKFNALAMGCYERGIRMFDVADLYGTHPFLAEAMKNMRREDYVIGSKIWFRSGGVPEPERPSPDVVVERFLRELKTDYIDLMLFHCTTTEKWPEELGDQMEILAKLKKKGIIRAHGVSCHSVAALKRCIKEPWVDSVHARFNPYALHMDVKTVEELPKVEKVLKAIRREGKAVIGMKIMGQGELRKNPEKRDESIKYALESGCVDAMVVGFEKVEEVDDFAMRVRKVSVGQGLGQLHALRSARVA